MPPAHRERPWSRHARDGPWRVVQGVGLHRPQAWRTRRVLPPPTTARQAVTIAGLLRVQFGGPGGTRTQPLTRFKRSPLTPVIASGPNLVDAAGVEPATSRLSAERTEPLCFASMVGWCGFDPLLIREQFYRLPSEAIAFPNPNWSHHSESD